MRKLIHKTPVVWLLALVLLTGSLAVPARAAEPNTPKEEVVYASLDGSGALQRVDVVNIFDLPEGGVLRDYGDYQSVRNMTSSDELLLEDGTVSGQVQPGKLYYEGQLTDRPLPWDFSIRYTLDGEPVSPEEVAGSSGQLDIALAVRQNPLCEGPFFDEYALQVSLSLDTDRCRNIRAEGAAVANVGSNKQLTYTVLPGMGLDSHITAQVEDFEMEAISFNGVALNLSLNTDTSALTGQAGALLDAVAALDEGAGSLAEGTADLASGTDPLVEGALALQEGTNTLADAAPDLSSGATQIQQGLQALSDQSESLNTGATQLQSGLAALNSQLAETDLSGGDLSSLAAASGQIRAAVEEIASSLSALSQSVPDPGALIQQNNTAAEGLQSTAAALEDPQLQALLTGSATLLQQNSAALEGVSALGSSLAELSAGAATLQTNAAAFDSAVQALASSGEDPAALLDSLKQAVSTLSAGADALCQGIDAYTQGVSRLSGGAETLSDGTATLEEKVETLSAGAADLHTGLSQLADAAGQAQSGARALKEGTAALQENSQDLEKELESGIEDLLKPLTGEDREVVSFVSADNVQVSSVQFVIRSAAVHVPEPEPAPEEPADETGFWQKLTALFR